MSSSNLSPFRGIKNSNLVKGIQAKGTIEGIQHGMLTKVWFANKHLSQREKYPKTEVNKLCYLTWKFLSYRSVHQE